MSALFFKPKWLTTTYGPSYPAVEEEVKHIKNRLYLRIIAKWAKESDLRVIATGAIKSQSFLVRLARKSEDIDVKLAALKGIKKAGKRLPIALSVIDDTCVCDDDKIAAIETIINDYDRVQEKLREIAARTKSSSAAIRAAELMNDSEYAHEIFMREAANGKYSDDRSAALQHIKNSEDLLKIVKETSHDSTALETAKKIQGSYYKQQALYTVASNKKFSVFCRYDAALMLQDTEAKREICKELLTMAQGRLYQQSGECVWKVSEYDTVIQGCKRILEDLW